MAECKAELMTNENQQKKMFNFTTLIVDDSELSKVLKERTEEDSTYLIGVMPEFAMKGEEDNSEWENILSFLVLDKTDYSEHDRDAYINIFATTQIKAKAFVDKLIDDKANHEGVFCNFLAKLDIGSITVKPVWKKESCNGWIIELNFDSPT